MLAKILQSIARFWRARSVIGDYPYQREERELHLKLRKQQSNKEISND